MPLGIYIHIYIYIYIGDTVNLPDLWEDETEDIQTTDKLEETIQQYNYLISSQLEEQRSHFEEKLEERKAKISLI